MAKKAHADILLVTATEAESKAVLRAFGVDWDHGQPNRGQYYCELGKINGERIAVTQCEPGAVALGASLQTIAKALEPVPPKAVIMVGIAFGMNEEKQKVGQILVAKHLQLYEIVRIGTDDDGGARIVPRGDKPHASLPLLRLFRVAALSWKGANHTFGTVLTGEKLVDNLDFRSQLQALYPGAIGGEMEGAGLYAACAERKVNWILVKAICDFADGNKAQDKEQRQALAASNAVAFVLHALKFSQEDRAVAADVEVGILKKLRRGRSFLSDTELASLIDHAGDIAESIHAGSKVDLGAVHYKRLVESGVINATSLRFADPNEFNYVLARLLVKETARFCARLLSKLNLIYDYQINLFAVPMLLNRMQMNSGAHSRPEGSACSLVTFGAYIRFLAESRWREPGRDDWRKPKEQTAMDGTEPISNVDGRELARLKLESGISPRTRRGPDEGPVGGVSWYDAVAYCLHPSVEGRLPTVEELCELPISDNPADVWEWSCSWFQKNAAHVAVVRKGIGGEREIIGVNPDLRLPKIGFRIMKSKTRMAE
jgi:nucleoside phosphorylase